jgi:ABC-type nickel/cobalt efflux system permease component RcnA
MRKIARRLRRRAIHSKINADACEIPRLAQDQPEVIVDSVTLLGLLGTAAFVGFLHTLAGPDHYVPFIALARVGRWSLTKTLVITFACGVGHVASSIALGFVGIVASFALSHLEWFEGLRGDLAAWLLFGFGLAYMAWGLRQALRNRPHAHVHMHADGAAHRHVHTHHDDHAHPHTATEPGGPTSMTPWILFTIFVFGPCEPLIPILMYPALKLSVSSVLLVAAVFAACTIGTMLMVVSAACWGLARVPTARLARYSHALAGFALAACGGAMLAGL